MGVPPFTQKYEYTTEQATERLLSGLEVVLLLPDTSVYLEDISKGHETIASRPVLYRLLRRGLSGLAEEAGLTLQGISRVAYIPEQPRPEIVSKVIETVGRQILLDTLLQQSDAAELMAIIDAANTRLANSD